MTTEVLFMVLEDSETESPRIPQIHTHDTVASYRTN